jgi:hypothetical protein
VKFRIKLEALNGTERTLDSLDIVMGRVEDSVHELEIHDADELNQSAWFLSSRAGRRKLLEEIASNALRTGPRTSGPHLKSYDISTEKTAEIARNLAVTPLSVLLENADSDGALVETAVRFFGNAATVELCFGSPKNLGRRAVDFESRGGEGELKKLVKSRVQVSLQNGIPLRCVVVTDCDGEYVGEVKRHAQEIRDLCLENNIACPPLNKRTAENYIPDEIWAALAHGRENEARVAMVAAIHRLSPSQRDYVRFDKKNTAPWNKDNPLATELFAGVSEEDYELLLSSSLKGHGDGMTIFALRSHASLLGADVLARRDAAGELAYLAKKIEDEL